MLLRTARPYPGSEAIFARELADLASEIRLADAGALTALIREGRHASLNDLVASSCELLYDGMAWRYAGRAQMRLTWTAAPVFSLDLEFARLGVSAFLTLHLHAFEAYVHLHYLALPPAHEPALGLIGRALADARRGGRAHSFGQV